MKLGQVEVQFAVQRNPPVYYGARDPVHGHLILSFSNSAAASPASTELSGPLRLELDLEGTLKTHVDRTKPVFTRKTLLFRNNYVLYNDTLRLSTGEKKEFPFTVLFPKDIDPIPSLEVYASESQRGKRCRLPPSFHRGSQDAWKKASGISISYELKAHAIMGGIDVDIFYPPSCPILTYEPALPDPEALNQTRHVDNTWHLPRKELFPQIKEHHGGFLQGVHRAMFVDKPLSVLSIQCVGIPRHIFVGQRLAFDIRMQIQDAVAEGVPRPEVLIDSCKVTLRGLTRLSRADTVVSKIGYVEDYREVSEDLAVLAADIQPDGRLVSEDEFKMVTTGPLGVMSSTFKLGKISHRHRVRVEMRVRVANHQLGFIGECDVTMHAASLDGYEGDVAEELPEYESLEGQ